MSSYPPNPFASEAELRILRITPGLEQGSMTLHVVCYDRDYRVSVRASGRYQQGDVALFSIWWTTAPWPDRLTLKSDGNMVVDCFARTNT